MDTSDQEVQRPTWEEYPDWLLRKSSVADLQIERVRFENAGIRIREAIEASAFWGKVVGSSEDLNDEYFSLCGYQLFAAWRKPEVRVKPFESVLNKSFRKNVLLNKSWPTAPHDEWITPSNWLTRLNDIARTTMIVKYLDGIDYLVQRLQAFATNAQHSFKVDYEAREEGYYAAHCYIGFYVDLPTVDWHVESVSTTFEVQITTQLQDVIRGLTHKYYEQRRSRDSVPSVKWQWDHNSSEFIPNYLGHILQFLEGMIMEVRTRGEQTWTTK